MAQSGQKDLLTRLADAGEDALSRLASSPGMERVTGAVSSLKDQVDALASKVRGMDALEKRIEDLERKVEKLSKASGSKTTGTARKTASSRKTSSSKKS